MKRTALTIVSALLEDEEPSPEDLVQATGDYVATVRSNLFKQFFNAYLEAAPWSSSDGEHENLDAFEWGEGTKDKLMADAIQFYEQNRDDISDDLTRAGHDFWLTRNGHGAGFWDGDWEEEVGKRLTKASKKFGEVNLYLGDDELIYVM